MPFPFPRKRRRGASDITAGGSRIIRHAAAEVPPFGFMEVPTEIYVQQREEVYDRLFGPCESVYHELLPFSPHVDVYVIPPRPDEREFYTLVTGGMSDQRMGLPPQADKELARAELVMYVREPREKYADLLRGLAHFPHAHKSWLSHGHTIPNGQPAMPLFEGSRLDTLLLMWTIVLPDSTLSESLVLEGDPVNLLWVVPITSRECDLKLHRGLDRLLDVFERVRHPVVLDEHRRSYV